MTKEKKNLPEKKLKAGLITATIWKAKDEKIKAHNVVFEKSYRDKEGNWASSNNFSTSDLPTVAWLAWQAFEYITKKE